MRELLAVTREEFLLILGAFPIIARELWAIRLTGPRAHQCTMTAMSVALSVTAAQALHMDYVWWAGISGRPMVLTMKYAGQCWQKPLNTTGSVRFLILPTIFGLQKKSASG